MQSKEQCISTSDKRLVSVFLYRDGPEHNDELCSLIRHEQKKHPYSRLGVGQGWTGPKTFFSLQQTYPLWHFICSSLPGGFPTTISGWGNILGAGDEIGWHDHDILTNTWSGVYYPRSGGGAIEFENGETFEPQESSLIVFPSNLKHRVTATAERFSIAWNARV